MGNFPSSSHLAFQILNFFARICFNVTPNATFCMPEFYYISRFGILFSESGCYYSLYVCSFDLFLLIHLFFFFILCLSTFIFLLLYFLFIFLSFFPSHFFIASILLIYPFLLPSIPNPILKIISMFLTDHSFNVRSFSDWNKAATTSQLNFFPFFTLACHRHK